MKPTEESRPIPVPEREGLIRSRSLHLVWGIAAFLLLVSLVLGFLVFSYRTDLAATKDQLSTEQNRAARLEAEKAELMEDIEDLEQQRSELEGQVSGLEGELGSAQGAVGSLVSAIGDCWDALDVATEAYNAQVDAYNALLSNAYASVEAELDFIAYQLLPEWDRAERRCFNPPQAPPPPPNPISPL
jgi:septal ring factor EnvC (AmiA/AmiB activator)